MRLDTSGSRLVIGQGRRTDQLGFVGCYLHFIVAASSRTGPSAGIERVPTSPSW